MAVSLPLPHCHSPLGSKGNHSPTPREALGREAITVRVLLLWHHIETRDKSEVSALPSSYSGKVHRFPMFTFSLIKKDREKLKLNLKTKINKFS